jgi:hypothetical protein
MNSVDELRQVICKRCDEMIEVCELCEQENCPHALCYHCVRIVLGQEEPQPHDHGG